MLGRHGKGLRRAVVIHALFFCELVVEAQDIGVFGSDMLAHLEEGFASAHHRVNVREDFQFFIPVGDPDLTLGARAAATLTKAQGFHGCHG